MSLFIWGLGACHSSKSTQKTSSKTTQSTQKKDNSQVLVPPPPPPPRPTPPPPAPKEEPQLEYSKDSPIRFIVSDNLTAVMEKAKKENKVVFLDFYTTWCAPCRLMDQSVFRDEDVVKYMNDNCVSMKINAEKGEGVALKIQYGVGVYPTYIFINKEGDEVSKREGSLSIDEFKKFMKSGVWKVKN